MGNKVAEVLKPGDVVELSTARLPGVGRFKAAVESSGEGQFSVFTLELPQYYLSPEDLTFNYDGGDYQIHKRESSDHAVPAEAAGFKKGDLVKTTDGMREGYIVAALDGFVYLVSPEGEDWTCGVGHLIIKD